MRTLALSHALILSALTVTVARLVAAQAPPPDIDDKTKALVEQLVQEGGSELDAGKYQSACPKLAQAVQLAPNIALGARLLLGKCYEKSERPDAALEQYNAARSM